MYPVAVGVLGRDKRDGIARNRSCNNSVGMAGGMPGFVLRRRIAPEEHDMAVGPGRIPIVRLCDDDVSLAKLSAGEEFFFRPVFLFHGGVIVEKTLPSGKVRLVPSVIAGRTNVRPHDVAIGSARLEDRDEKARAVHVGLSVLFRSAVRMPAIPAVDASSFAVRARVAKRRGEVVGVVLVSGKLIDNAFRCP